MTPAPTLRAYQSRAVDALRGHLRAGKRRLLLVAPTGAGKTIVAAHIIASAVARGTRVVFLAHRRELISQTYAKLLDAGLDAASIGVIMGRDPRARADALVQIASVDTLRNRARPPANLVIVDECHRSLAKTYTDLITHYTERGATIVGLTATPYRADGRGLGDVYDVLEIVATPRELMDEGHLVEPRVFAARGLDLSRVRTRGGDYVEGDLADVLNEGGLVGDIVSTWQRHAEERRTVVFAVNVAHSKHIAARFVEAGVAAEHLDGETPSHERDAILARLASGQTRVVVNVAVLCEGWDMPSVKCAVLARPTKSTGLYLQQAGRILRPWESVGALILDHAGNVAEHGLPQDDRVLTLDTSKPARVTVTTKVCPECSAVSALAVRTCECGYVFPVASAPEREPIGDERAGELVEVTSMTTAEIDVVWGELVEEWRRRNVARLGRGEPAMKPGWIHFRFLERTGRKAPSSCKLPFEVATEDEKRAAWRELREQATTRSYKPGWAVWRYRERFGERPPRSVTPEPAIAI